MRSPRQQVLADAADDNAADAAAFRADLMNIARTTLSSKLVTHEKHHFAELAVDAVLRLKVNESFLCCHLGDMVASMQTQC